MKLTFISRATAVAFTTACVLSVAAGSADRNPVNHKIHDPERPIPPKVDPGPVRPPAPAPSDAIVLFDGSSFDQWQHSGGSASKWKIVQGNMQVVPGAGDIETKKQFGDVQLHIEWKADPNSPKSGQGRSNSGVFFGSYEVQVLDTFENKTYADGMAGSIYGQYPPLVNASRKAGEWQTFDIVYIRPRFDDSGKLQNPAKITVFHNGVLVQHAEELVGPTSHARRTEYSPHGAVPIRLQDHRDDPIEFRNIWARELE